MNYCPVNRCPVTDGQTDENRFIKVSSGTSACPEKRQRVQIFTLFILIGLCGVINAQKNFGPLQHILPPYRAEFHSPHSTVSAITAHHKEVSFGTSPINP